MVGVVFPPDRRRKERGVRRPDGREGAWDLGSGRTIDPLAAGLRSGLATSFATMLQFFSKVCAAAAAAADDATGNLLKSSGIHPSIHPSTR